MELTNLCRINLITVLFIADLAAQKDILNRELIGELQKMYKHKDIKVKLVSLIVKDMPISKLYFSIPVCCLFPSVICGTEVVIRYLLVAMKSIGRWETTKLGGRNPITSK